MDALTQTNIEPANLHSPSLIARLSALLTLQVSIFTFLAFAQNEHDEHRRVLIAEWTLFQGLGTL